MGLGDGLAGLKTRGYESMLVARNSPHEPVASESPGERSQGAHMRASRPWSGALGVPAERPRGFGAKPRLINKQ